jgi:hypothetical protein
MAIDVVAFKRPEALLATCCLVMRQLPCIRMRHSASPAHKTDMIDQQIASGFDLIHRRNTAKIVA